MVCQYDNHTYFWICIVIFNASLQRDGTYYVTMLIIPKQEATAHSVRQKLNCFET